MGLKRHKRQHAYEKTDYRFSIALIGLVVAFAVFEVIHHLA